jgi:hypothetical protein
MGFFERFKRKGGAQPLPVTPDADQVPVEDPAPEHPVPPEPPPPVDEPPPLREPEPDTEIKVSRTLVKSEPELAALVASEPSLASDGVQVSLTEKGFGTRVAITAAEPSGLSADDLERLLDVLAEPQKRPFTNS